MYTFCPFPKTGAAMSASASISAPVFLSRGRGRNAHRVPFPAPAGTEGITHYTLRGKVVCQRGAPLWNPPAFPFLSRDGQNVRHVGQSRKRPQRRHGFLRPESVSPLVCDTLCVSPAPRARDGGTHAFKFLTAQENKR